MNFMLNSTFRSQGSSMELDENDVEITLVPDTDKNEAERMLCPNMDRIAEEVVLTINEDNECLGEREQQQPEIDFKPEPEVERNPKKITIPVMSILIITFILVCELLDATGVVSARYDMITRHPLLLPWFNCGGFKYHTIPNIVFFSLVAIPIELMVGSLNFFLQWLMGLYFVIPYCFTVNCYTGNGSSIQVYFQFTVFGGALFISKFLFPALVKINSISDGETTTDKRIWTAMDILKAICWWFLGFLLLFCGGWILNGVAYYIWDLTIGRERIAHFTHDVFCGIGYFGTLLLGALLWYQNPLENNISLNDMETKIGFLSLKMVWIKRQVERHKMAKLHGKCSTMAKNHPIFPFCREILLVLAILFCLVFGSWLFSGLGRDNQGL